MLDTIDIVYGKHLNLSDWGQLPIHIDVAIESSAFSTFALSTANIYYEHLMHRAKECARLVLAESVLFEFENVLPHNIATPSVAIIDKSSFFSHD